MSYHYSADSSANFEQQYLKITLDNRVICTGWDGKPRKCRTCNKYVETERLKLINATQCKTCIQQIDWEDEDE